MIATKTFSNNLLTFEIIKLNKTQTIIIKRSIQNVKN